MRSAKVRSFRPTESMSSRKSIWPASAMSFCRREVRASQFAVLQSHLLAQEFVGGAAVGALDIAVKARDVGQEFFEDILSAFDGIKKVAHGSS